MIDATTVVLTSGEMWNCIEVAAERIGDSRAAGRKHDRNADRTFKERITQEIVGACAEKAVCKAEGWEWNPEIDTFKVIPDVGGKYDVRSSEHARHCLIIRPDDPPGRWYIFVTGRPPVMTIRGCLRGQQARNPTWWRNPGGKPPAWFVPQGALRPYIPPELRDAS